jgi:hypothetical protein
MTRRIHAFIRGMGSALDLMPTAGPTRVGEGLNFARTDAEALRQDGMRIAEDFCIAFDKTFGEGGGHHVEPKQEKE